MDIYGKAQIRCILDHYYKILVAKDYTQTCDIDYEETFEPMAKMNTLLILIYHVAYFGKEFQQFDVKNALLHGNLENEVYMEIPSCFDIIGEANKVC